MEKYSGLPRPLLIKIITTGVYGHSTGRFVTLTFIQNPFITSKHYVMKNVNKMLIALGAGVAIGGILGVLFAPKKGSELRKDIANNGKKLKSELKEKYYKGKEKLNGLRREAGEMSEEFS